MKLLVNATVLTGMAVGLVLGPCCFLLGWQLDMVANVGEPAAQTMTVAQLIDGGRGDNAHVELTHFKLGKPTVESERDQLTDVWIPVYPAGEKPSSKRMLVWRTR